MSRTDEGIEADDSERPEEAPRIAVFRPADERIERAVERLESLGVEAVADPMLSVEPTGATPGPGRYVILTSKTGVELAAEAGWGPDEATLVAIGPATAAAAREAGWTVDLIPEAYTSTGLVELLTDAVDGERVEVARSDHGSEVLLDGLREAGADLNETVLYRLVRPEGSGESAEMAARGELDAVAFTSSLTVVHFLEAAEERGIREEAIEGVNRAVVGVIGPPTAETATEQGIEVDVVPETAEFDALAAAVVKAVRERERREKRE